MSIGVATIIAIVVLLGVLHDRAERKRWARDDYPILLEASRKHSSYDDRVSYAEQQLGRRLRPAERQWLW